MPIASSSQPQLIPRTAVVLPHFDGNLFFPPKLFFALLLRAASYRRGVHRPMSSTAMVIIPNPEIDLFKCVFDIILAFVVIILKDRF
jgi:hypothetical protein